MRSSKRDEVSEDEIERKDEVHSEINVDSLDDEAIIDAGSDKAVKGTPCISVFCCIVLPCSLLCGINFVDEGTEHVNLVCGKYGGTVSTPGCYFKNCFFLERRVVSRKIRSVDLPNQKIVDKRGNPLYVSAVITYQVLNARKSVLEVTDVRSYVIAQAQAILKQHVSKYPFECMNADDNQLSLRKDGRKIERNMIADLQRSVEKTGVKIHSVQFNELSYAPEISSGMLKKQSAMVMVSAKKMIVQGAVGIAHGVVEKLSSKGLKMLPEEKTKLVSNLLTVLCSDEDDNENVQYDDDRGPKNNFGYFR